MNSSISTSEGDSGKARGKTFLFFAVFIVSLGAVLIFNRFVDPYNVFGGNGRAAQALRGRANLVMEAMVDVAKVPRSDKQSAAIVVIGDSRARALTTLRAEGGPDAPVLNLGVGGASFEEAVTMLRDEAPHLSSMGLLIATLPFERFSAAPRPNRCDEVRSLVTHPFRYLANAEILQHSWTLWRTRAATPNQSPLNSRTPAEQSAEDVSVQTTWRRMYADFDRARVEERIKQVEQAVQPLAARGVKVVYWFPPVRENISALLPELGLEGERENLQSRLRKSGEVVDMTKWTSLHETPFTFSDPVHTQQSPALYRELAARLPRPGLASATRQ